MTYFSCSKIKKRWQNKQEAWLPRDADDAERHGNSATIRSNERIARWKR